MAVRMWTINAARGSGATIASWLHATRGREVSFGLGVDEAMSGAADLLNRLKAPGAASQEVIWSADLPDLLFAFCRHLRDSPDTDCVRTLDAIREAYLLAEGLSWTNDLFEERSEILALLAFLGWTQARHLGRHTEMTNYEIHCENHVKERESLRQFLEMPFDQRSEAVNEVCLSDPPFLLASLTRLERLRDSDPQFLANEAPKLYAWVVATPETRSEDETAWFAAEFARHASGGSRFAGTLREAQRWLASAQSWLGRVQSRTILGARLRYTGLTILYDGGRYEAVLEGIAALREEFGRQGMEAEVAKVAFLEANALKACGNSHALTSFLRLLEHPAIRSEPVLLGMSLVNAGDLSAREGRHAFAMKCFGEAWPLLEAAGACWCLAYLRGAVAEVLRDQGHLDAAITAYRAAIASYAGGGMSLSAAYVRIILAETLIAAGKEGEAVVELLAALPVIERESLEREGVAASALLRASLQRCQADPEALRELREQLDRMRRGGEL